MRKLAIGAAALVGLLAAYVLAHLLLIEAGREVIVLRTRAADGAMQETRLWIVDDAEGRAWLHGGPDAGWMGRIAVDPDVEIERAGATRRYRAVPVPGPHVEIDRLLREKYGVADRWVRFVAPDNERTAPVRLEPL